jgi:amino acid transporter
MQERPRVIRRRTHGGAEAPPEEQPAEPGAGEGRAAPPPAPPPPPPEAGAPGAVPPAPPPVEDIELARAALKPAEPGAPAGAPPPPAGGATSRRHVDILAPEPEPTRGRHLGDRVVRLVRPKLEGVRRVEAGVYEIVSAPPPRSRLGRFWTRAKRTLLGAPIRTEHEAHERVSVVTGLAAFGTDNISSSAYATEELMRVLVLAGAVALALTMPISIAIIILLAIVVTSYQQTIRAYPQGGGSYIVTSRNLGTLPGLVAGASILVDYVLTVAVSTSAGVAALTSAFPALYANRVLIAVVAVAVIAWGNLRGIRESSALFALPCYAYLASWFSLLAYGLYRYAAGDQPVYVPPPTSAEHHPHGMEVLSLFLILRAFASGSVGLTGTEAIADGAGAFKPPSDRNARITLVLMATCFGTIFLGISFLSSWLGIIPDPAEVETVNSQLTRTLVGTGWFYYLVQFATALLLVLAANTAFADFPRLAYFMARDKFLPSQFKERGVRLAYSNGIIVLSLVAAILIIVFRGSVTSLIPLYTVGVFLAFTLSQSSLVARWWRTREPGWRWRLAINATGATVTCIVMVVVAVTKFALGAWVVLLLIPTLVCMLLGVRHHFRDVEDQLAVDPNDKSEHPDRLVTQLHHYIIIPVADLNRAALRAIAYARSLTGAPSAEAGAEILDRRLGTRRVVIQAVHVTDDPAAANELQRKWEKYNPGVELVIIESPYRGLIGPLLRYIDAVERRHPEGTAIVTVLLPEYIPARWWELLLHTHTALQLKGALLFRPRTAVTSVPWHLHA